MGVSPMATDFAGVLRFFMGEMRLFKSAFFDFYRHFAKATVLVGILRLYGHFARGDCFGRHSSILMGEMRLFWSAFFDLYGYFAHGDCFSRHSSIL